MINSANAGVAINREEKQQVLNDQAINGAASVNPIGGGRAPIVLGNKRRKPEESFLLRSQATPNTKTILATHNSFLNEQFLIYKKLIRRLRAAQATKARLTKYVDMLPKWATCQTAAKVQVPKQQKHGFESKLKSILDQASKDIFTAVGDCNTREITEAQFALSKWPETLSNECKAIAVREWNHLPEFFQNSFQGAQFKLTYANILFDHVHDNALSWQLKETALNHHKDLQREAKALAAAARLEEFAKFKAESNITEHTVLEKLVDNEVKRAMKRISRSDNPEPSKKKQPEKANLNAKSSKPKKGKGKGQQPNKKQHNAKPNDPKKGKGKKNTKKRRQYNKRPKMPKNGQERT